MGESPTGILSCGICILAGGLSSRMGRDKAKLRLGGRTLLGHAKAQAKALGLPVRIIRRDLIRGRGPIGGIYTGLKTSRRDAELFLACDMPFVSVPLLGRILKKYAHSGSAVFVATGSQTGFPFLVPRKALPAVQSQIQAEHLSLQRLTVVLRAKVIRVSARQQKQLININTPADRAEAVVRIRERALLPQRDVLSAGPKMQSRSRVHSL